MVAISLKKYTVGARLYLIVYDPVKYPTVRLMRGGCSQCGLVADVLLVVKGFDEQQMTCLAIRMIAQQFLQSTRLRCRLAGQ